jgi:hypothetical protein
MSAMLVILVLGLPLFTPAAPLLLNTSGNTMKVFVVVVFFHRTSFFFVTFSRIFRLTFPAPNPQPVRAGTILAKLILVFTFFTFTALLHFLHPYLKPSIAKQADLFDIGFPQDSGFYHTFSQKTNIRFINFLDWYQKTI